MRRLPTFVGRYYKMNVTIRNAKEQDVPQMYELIMELAVFEKESDAVIISKQDLLDDGFGLNPAYFCFVACEGESVVGMALFFPKYSTWKGRVLHLEDLVVRQEHRKKGIGTKLLRRVIQYAHDQGVKRIDWAVLDWNTPAVELYKHIGAEVSEEWRIAQLEPSKCTLLSEV